jgi:hypothetical protein
MFDINKPKQKPVVIIRAATAGELSNYEKHKLASIEDNAQENKIETIKVNVDGSIQQIEPLNKEVTIDLGKLALKSSVTPADMSSDELFFIKCELDSTTFYEQN